MSETIARTWFMTTVKGKKVFSDWCLINTSLGQMIEPVNINWFTADGQAYDPADSVSLVTEIQEVDFNRLASLPPFTDAGIMLHGGTGNPRTGF